MIVSGVLNGSQGPLFYPQSEIAENPTAWNGIPITLRHPALNGRPVSARHPSVLESQGLGYVFSAGVGRGPLDAEAWFDEEQTRSKAPDVHAAITNGKPVEVSTGLYTDNEPAPAGAAHNGRHYAFVAKRYRPDHLAVLPDQKGACSVDDGCGLFVGNNNPQGCNQFKKCGGSGRQDHGPHAGNLGSRKDAESFAEKHPGVTIKEQKNGYGKVIGYGVHSPDAETHSRVMKSLFAHKTRLKATEASADALANTPHGTEAHAAASMAHDMAQEGNHSGAADAHNVAADLLGHTKLSGSMHLRAAETHKDAARRTLLYNKSHLFGDPSFSQEDVSLVDSLVADLIDDGPTANAWSQAARLAAQRARKAGGRILGAFAQKAKRLALRAVAKVRRIPRKLAKGLERAAGRSERIEDALPADEPKKARLRDRTSGRAERASRLQAGDKTGGRGKTDEQRFRETSRRQDRKEGIEDALPADKGRPDKRRASRNPDRQIMDAIPAKAADARPKARLDKRRASRDPNRRKGGDNSVVLGGKRVKTYALAANALCDLLGIAYEVPGMLYGMQPTSTYPIDCPTCNCLVCPDSGMCLGCGLATNALPNQPRSLERGTWKTPNAGTGRGETHRAAQAGSMILTDLDRELGEEAVLDYAERGENPAGWAVDEGKWKRAKEAATEGGYTGDTFWAVVAHIYQNMGGRIGQRRGQTQNAAEPTTNAEAPSAAAMGPSRDPAGRFESKKKGSAAARTSREDYEERLRKKPEIGAAPVKTENTSCGCDDCKAGKKCPCKKEKGQSMATTNDLLEVLNCKGTGKPGPCAKASHYQRAYKLTARAEKLGTAKAHGRAEQAHRIAAEHEPDAFADHFAQARQHKEMSESLKGAARKGMAHNQKNTTAMLLDNCGGKGGKPGPCPMGGGGASGGGGSSPTDTHGAVSHLGLTKTGSSEFGGQTFASVREKKGDVIKKLKAAGYEQDKSAHSSVGSRWVKPGGDHHINVSEDRDEMGRKKTTISHRKLTTNQAGADMNRDQMISYLTTNCSCWKEKGAVLGNKEAFSDDDLRRLVAENRLAQERTAVVNSLKNQLSIGDGVALNAMPAALAEALAKKGKGPMAGKKKAEMEDEDEEMEDEEEPTGNHRASSYEEWFKMAPQGAQEVWNSAVRLNEHERARLVGQLQQLAANTRVPGKKERLEALLEANPTINQLQAAYELAAEAPVENSGFLVPGQGVDPYAATPNYGGLGHLAPTSNSDLGASDQADHVYTMPALDFDQLSKQGSSRERLRA